MSHAVGGFDVAAYLPLLEEELAHRGEDRRGPDVAQGRGRSRRRLPRRWSSAPACRACSPATACPGRRRLRHRREERRRRRHLVREQLSGLPGRQPEPQLQLLVRPAPRLAVPLLHPAGAARLLPRLRRRLRAAGRHPVPHRGRVGHVVGRRRALDGRAAAGPTATRRSSSTRSSAPSGQLNRPHMPEIPGRRHVRRPRVPLGAVAPRRRPDRQARGGHRHRGQRHAAHPRDRRRRRRAAGVPAHPGVDGAHARVPRRRARRADLALRARALVQRVQPLLHLLEDGRRRARQRARRPRLGPARLGRHR